jgi:hypothetical protein
MLRVRLTATFEILVLKKPASYFLRVDNFGLTPCNAATIFYELMIDRGRLLDKDFSTRSSLYIESVNDRAASARLRFMSCFLSVELLILCVIGFQFQGKRTTHHETSFQFTADNAPHGFKSLWMRYP